MVDDDLNMVALPETRNIKSIVTAEDRLCIERKNKQAVQGLLYVRFICFGNGNLVAAHDDSDGFWRRQILITVKDRDPARVDNPFLIEELSEERPGILLWMLKGLHRLLANRYQFTISERSIQNLKTYEEAIGGRWKMETPMPEFVKNMVVKNVADVEDVGRSSSSSVATQSGTCCWEG